MSTTTGILGNAPITTTKFVASGTPGFSGDGSGLTNLPASGITLSNPNFAVITNGSSQLTTEQFLSTVRGGTGVNSSAFTGVAKVAAGVWTASQVTSSDIASATILGSNIASAAITGTNIASAAITGSNIANSTITNANIVPATITGASIASATITSTNIGVAGVSNANLATLSTAGLVSNSATTATNANTASAIVARDASGNFIASNVTVTQLVESPNANGQFTIQSAFVTTANATPTTLLSLATVSAGTHGTSYLITVDISLGDVTGGVNTGSYQFQFKVKNIGGTLTISSLINDITILDGGLTATTVTVTSSSANVLVQVTGIAATSINWIGSFKITQVNF